MTSTSRQAVLLLTAFATALAALLLSYSPPAQAETTVTAVTTFTVNSTGDDEDQDSSDYSNRDDECSTGGVVKDAEGRDAPECTLRAAIQNANQNHSMESGPTPDTIAFDIPTTDPGYDSATGVFTIAPPLHGMPQIEDPLTIDGYTQPGASPNTRAVGNDASLKIELSGRNIAGDQADYGSNGLNIMGSPYEDNLGADGSVVRGLVINDFPWGAGDYGFSAHGIDINYADDVVIEGNFIGTDAAGTADRGNEWNGVWVEQSKNVTVGGTTPAARNLISANGLGGVSLYEGTSGSKIQGNYIGTDRHGTADLGNGGGVGMENASDNIIGGTDSRSAGNIIAFNGGGIGVGVEEGINSITNIPRIGKATGNSILGNSIFSNKGAAPKEVDPDDPLLSLGDPLGGLGINLVGGENADNWYSDSYKYGITLNDRKDPDSGANNLQNYPVLRSARASGSSTSIKGTLDSRPVGRFTIQFFSSPEADRSGYGEGKTFLGQTTVKTESAGVASFTFAASSVAVGEVVTATATNNSTGDTSEFSKTVTVR